MRKILVFFIGFSILFTASSCEKKKASSKLTFVDIETKVNKMEKLYLSQFTSNIRYIPLENEPDHPMAWVDYMDLSDNYILVSDGRSCLLYNNDGHFIRIIGKQGRGPEEYTYINGVVLTDEKIFLRDLYNLNEYNLDGTFIKKYEKCFLADGKYYLPDYQTCMINDSMIFGRIENITGQIEFKAAIVDRQGGIKYNFKNFVKFNPEHGKHRAKRPQLASIHKFDNRIYFLEPFNDTLFQLNNQNQLIPEYVFSLGKFGEPLSERTKALEEYDGLKYFHINGILQTEKLLLINISFNKDLSVKRLTQIVPPFPISNKEWGWYNTTSVLGILEKRNGSLIFSEPTSTDIHLSTSGLNNDIDAGPRFLPDQMVNDSTMVMRISLDHLKEYIECDEFKNNYPKYPERKQRFEALVDSLAKIEFDNPVLMFVTFKNK